MPAKSAVLESPYKAPALVGAVLEGEVLCAERHAGKWVVVYFYPRDMTPGCTTESRDFARLAPQFAAQGALVYGVSKDSCESHRKFTSRDGLESILLISDTGSLCEDFGVWKEKSNYGKKYMGIERTTFLLDPRGEVRARWEKVKVDGHAEAVLSTLRELASDA
jgi:peroxiredoxin Q/BCP